MVGQRARAGVTSTWLLAPTSISFGVPGKVPARRAVSPNCCPPCLPLRRGSSHQTTSGESHHNFFWCMTQVETHSGTPTTPYRDHFPASTASTHTPLVNCNPDRPVCSLGRSPDRLKRSLYRVQEQRDFRARDGIGLETLRISRLRRRNSHSPCLPLL